MRKNRSKCLPDVFMSFRRDRGQERTVRVIAGDGVPEQVGKYWDIMHKMREAGIQLAGEAIRSAHKLQPR